MHVNGEREKVRFVSGGTERAAWHYPGRNGACVIMAGGFAVTKDPRHLLDQPVAEPTRAEGSRA